MKCALPFVLWNMFQCDVLAAEGFEYYCLLFWRSSSTTLGLLQQEFIPVLQASLTTSDRYQVHKACSWCAVSVNIFTHSPIVFDVCCTTFCPYIYIFPFYFLVLHFDCNIVTFSILPHEPLVICFQLAALLHHIKQWDSYSIFLDNNNFHTVYMFVSACSSYMNCFISHLHAAEGMLLFDQSIDLYYTLLSDQKWTFESAHILNTVKEQLLYYRYV